MKGYTRSIQLAITVLSFVLLTVAAASAESFIVGEGEQFATIAEAIEAAATDDYIRVNPGVYKESNLNFSGKDITLFSLGGAGATVIDCEKNGRAFYFNSNETTAASITGFTIVNGSSDSGGAIRIDNASPILERIIFHDNNASSFGGAISLTNSSSQIKDCLFYNNTAGGFGGALEIVGSPAGIDIVNCTFHANSSDNGGAIDLDSSVLNLSNSIFWKNSARLEGAQINIYNESATLNISNCDLDGSVEKISNDSPGVLNDNGGMIDADPLFHGRGNYRLRPGSPCINAGAGTFEGYALDGSSGTQRTEDSETDMGAYEYNAVTMTPENSLQDYIDSAEVPDGSTIIMQPGTYTIENDFFTIQDRVLALVSSGGAENPVIIDGHHQKRGFVITRQTKPATVAFEGFLFIHCSSSESDPAVSSQGYGAAVYADDAVVSFRNTAFIDNYAVSGGAVYVTNTAFEPETDSFGFFSPVTVAGCLFKKNTSRNAGGAFAVGSGTETYPTAEVDISDTLFYRNRCLNFSGGAVSIETVSYGALLNASIRNSRFIENQALIGGAVYVSGAQSVVGSNLVFLRNDSKLQGSAVYLKGSNEFETGTASFFFSTFSGNHSGAGEGAFTAAYNWLSVNIYNSILWGNVSSDTTAYQLDMDKLNIHSSVLQGGVANIKTNTYGVDIQATAVLDEDPMLAYDLDLRLMPESPCIDQGTDSLSVPMPSTDLDAHARMIDGNGDGTVAPDMGAYEHPLPVTPALAVSQEFITFTYNKTKKAIPDSQKLLLKNNGGSTFAWKFEQLPSWLSVSPDGTQERHQLIPGQEEGISLSCLPDELSGLSHGSYTAAVSVYDTDSGEKLATLQIELLVSETIVVPTDYPTIQGAIDAAVDGDLVLVEAGTYTGIGNRDISFLGKAIMVKSSSGPVNTIIDMEGLGGSRGFIFNSGETTSSVLDGFTLTNSMNSAIFLDSSATIVNCIFATNGFVDNPAVTDWNGGALRISGNGSYIANCTFNNNWAGYYYTGIAGVRVGNGGAVQISGDDNVIYNCSFNSNGTAPGGNYTGHGGAIMVGGAGNVIRQSFFQSNHAETAGGAVSLYSTDRNYIENCTFKSNNAVSSAGALYCLNGLVTNSVFNNNTSALSSAVSINIGQISNCSFISNSQTDPSGGCIEFMANVVPIVNTLFYNNSNNQLVTTSTGTAIVSYCTIPSTSSATADEDYNAYHNNSHITLGTSVYWYNDSSEQPMVDPSAEDFRLNPDFYYCIDRGTILSDIYSDIRGSVRPVDGDNDGSAEFDIGAYEYSRYYGGSEQDLTASPFMDLHIESSVILVGHEYEVEWKDKDPFPSFDERVHQSGEYKIMLSLISESGQRINLLDGPVTIRVSPLGYKTPVVFTPDHLGTWKIRLEMADDPNQFVESAPITIEYKEVLVKTMGERIYAPPGALADQKPDVDISDAVYWSADTKRLWAVKPTTAVIVWYADEQRTEEIAVVIHIRKPETPQLHVADTQPVDLLPDTTPYDMVQLLYNGSGAAINANTFTAVNEGYSVLFFRDEQAVDIENKEILQVVRTVRWDHQPVDGDDFTFPNSGIGYMGTELTDAGHNDECDSGYVFREEGWYDGSGATRAYDRASRQGPIFPVNALSGDNSGGDNDTRDDLLVVWYQKETTQGTQVCWPYKPVEYEIELPLQPATMVIASGLGSGELTAADFGMQQDMLIYNQPDKTVIGYNPNEEHASFFTAQGSEFPAAFALRDDLNHIVQDQQFTSYPYVLVKFRDPKNNNQWNFKPYRVEEQAAAYVINGGGFTAASGDVAGIGRAYINSSGIPVVKSAEEFPQDAYFLNEDGRLVNFQDRSLCYAFQAGSVSEFSCASAVPTYYINQSSGAAAPIVEKSNPTDVGLSLDEQGVIVDGNLYYRFHYPQEAGAEINPFYPLNQLTFGPCAQSFTTTPDWVLKDKDNKFFAENGGVNNGIQDVGVKYFYRLQAGFYYDRDGDGFQDTSTPIGTCIPLLDGGGVSEGDPLTVSFGVSWPDVVPTLYVGETLMDSKMQKGESVGLPNVKDQCSVQILFDQSVEQNSNYDKHSVNLIDPLKERMVDYGLTDPEGSLPAALKPKMNVSNGRWEFTALPEHLKRRLSYDPVDGEEGGLSGSLKLRGFYGVDSGEPTILLNALTARDIDTIDAVLADQPGPNDAVFTAKLTELNDAAVEYYEYSATGVVNGDRLYPSLSQFTAQSKALTAGDARGTGFVTLAFNNHEDCTAPTSLSVIRVGGPLYKGEIKVIESSNPFEEKLTLRHNGDFGGQSDSRWFQWKYLPADFSGIPCPPGETPASYGQDCVQKEWKDYFAVIPVKENGISVVPDDKNPEDADNSNNDENFYKGAVDVTVQGTGQQLLGDKWFSVRYFDDKKLLSSNYPVDYAKSLSGWTNPQLYEGWIKRVMKKINLFDQKAKDFHAGDVNTIASMIALAGAEYEGDIALSDSPEYLQNLGMIEVYETLLNRGVSLSGNTDSADINKALLFAGNRLADLFMLLGNEAYGDAADPTIGFSTESGEVGSQASSLFCFENQVDSLLDEELALLRGRSEPGIRPYYNRLVWNFTLGDGEIAYEQNYNITDQDTLDSDGDTFADTPDGELNEMDAKVMFPMGHGDAWGQYLSAVKEYYALMKRDNFTWIPQSEAILVAGNPVQVDYRDERKFAKAAAARARTGAEIVNLTYRKFYTEDPEGQWQGYKDTDIDRKWGLDGWSKRAGQGAFLDWVTGNAMLPDKPGVLEGKYCSDNGQTDFLLDTIQVASPADITVYANGLQLLPMDIAGVNQVSVPIGCETDPAISCEGSKSQVSLAASLSVLFPRGDDDHTYDHALMENEEVVFEVEMANSSFTMRDIQKIDRTTVVELAEIASAYETIQAKVDQADAQLNPLGIAKGTIPFDIDPARVANGETHFEQIYGRAVDAMNNAVAVFNFANQNTNMLRRQQDSLSTFKRNIENMEADYNNRLIEVYGYPYADDCGPGKTYPTEYCSDGADLYHYMYVDPFELTGTEPQAANGLMGVGDQLTHDFSVTLKDFGVNAEGGLEENEHSVIYHLATDSRYGLIKPASWTGKRKAQGEIQQSHGELLLTKARFEKAVKEYENLLDTITLQADLIETQYAVNKDEIKILNKAKDQQISLNNDLKMARSLSLSMQTAADLATLVANAVSEGFPTVTGLIAGFSNGAIIDVTSAGRAAAKVAGGALNELSALAGNVASISELGSQQAKEEVSLQSNIELTTLHSSFAVKQQLMQLENLVRSESVQRLELYTLMETLRQSGSRYLSVLAKGQRLLADRLRFRRQTAAQIQDYRYTDMAFRIFRNDALQKYRAQFDMAAQYVYLAAKAYDYETTLLDSDTRAGEDFLTSLVKQQTIGRIEGGVPLTGSGLADPMKRMYQNFQVLKPQLGFNNPQIETNRFSLRQELLRITMDSGSNATWRQALEQYRVADLWAVPEFRRYCRPFAPEGVPQPGLVIPFTTTVTPGLNFFKWPLGGGDSYYSSSNFATKIRAVGVWFSNYNAVGLAQTPRIYLVPVGEDILRTPSSSFDDIRTWQVVDQKMPQPFPFDSGELENNPDWIPSVDTIFDEMFEVRKHSDFRAYHDSGYINESEMQYDSRLIGRSVWNSRWLLIIPGQSLLYDPDEGLDTFINGPLIPGSNDERSGNGIFDIKLFFETYGYSGN